MSAPVRGFCFSLVLILLVSPAHAQEQELRIKKILKPDVTRGTDLQDKQFSGAKSFTSRKARVNDFYSPERFDAKPARTKNFLGMKNFGSREYSTREARTRSWSLTRLFSTKKYATLDNRDSTKNYGANTYAGQRDYRGREAALVAQPMTIDQVRALLNRN